MTARSARALAFGRLLVALAALLGIAWHRIAFAQNVEVQASIDETEVELGDTVTYTLQANSSTSDAPTDPKLAAPHGFTVVDSRMGPTHMVSIVNGRASEKHGLTASWTLRSDRLGTFTIGPASVAVGSTRKTAQAAKVVVIAPGTGKPKRRAQPTPFDPFGGRSPFDILKNPFPGFDDDFDTPAAGPPTDPALALDRERAPVAFLHATVDKTRAVVGEQVTLTVYLYEDIRARSIGAQDIHEPTATDFVKRALQDEAKIIQAGYAMVGGRPWSVKIIRKNALFPLKTGRLSIAPMSITLTPMQNGQRQSEQLTVDVSEPPVANRPAGYQIGDTGEFSLSSTTAPKSIDQNGAIGVTVELRGTGNMPSTLPLPEIDGVEWLEPQVRDNLGPVANDRWGGTRTFSYVVRLHKAGTIDLGEIRLPYWNPQTRAYDVARTSLGIVTVAKGAARDVAPEAANPVLADLPPARTALEGTRSATFITEHAVFWALLFGAPLACVATILIGGAIRRARERRAQAAPSPERVARERRSEAEASLKRDDGKEAVAAIGRALEAEILAATGVNVRGTSSSGAVRELVDAGVSEEAARTVTTVLSECHDARFAPDGVSMDTARGLWKRARAAVADAGADAPASMSPRSARSAGSAGSAA